MCYTCDLTVNDLCIQDSDCFYLEYLQYVQDKEGYLNQIHVFIKKIPPLIIFKMEELRKVQIDLEALMNSLQSGQTCEISDAYVGMTDKDCSSGNKKQKRL